MRLIARRFATTAELETWLRDFGCPAFMKLDGTSGGEGVRLLRDASEARAAFAEVSRNTGASGRFERHGGVRTEASQGFPRGARSASRSWSPANRRTAARSRGRARSSSVSSVVTLETYCVRVATLCIPSKPRCGTRRSLIARELKLSLFGLDFILQGEQEAAPGCWNSMPGRPPFFTLPLDRAVTWWPR